MVGGVNKKGGNYYGRNRNHSTSFWRPNDSLQ